MEKSLISKNAILLFIHIPKTAGTTFLNIVRRQTGSGELYELYSQEKINSLSNKQIKHKRVLMGHFRFGIHNYFEGKCMYFTFLRNPINHVISLYNHMKNSEDQDHKQLVKQYKSLQEYVSHPYARNLQTCYLTDMMFDEIEREPDLAIQTAKDNLNRYFLGVGIVERFDASLLFIKRVLKYTNVYYQKLNISSLKLRHIMPKETPTEVIRLIRYNNRCDLALYNFANELLDEQLANMPNIGIKLKKFLLLNSGNQLLFKIKRQLHYKRMLAKIEK